MRVYVAVVVVFALCCEATKPQRTTAGTRANTVKQTGSKAVHHITRPKHPKSHSVSFSSESKESRTSKKFKKMLKTLVASKVIKKGSKKHKVGDRYYYYGENNYRQESHRSGIHCVYHLRSENYIRVEDSSDSRDAVDEYIASVQERFKSVLTTTTQSPIVLIKSLHFTCPRSTLCCGLDCCSRSFAAPGVAVSATLYLFVAFAVLQAIAWA